MLVGLGGGGGGHHALYAAKVHGTVGQGLHHVVHERWFGLLFLDVQLKVGPRLAHVAFGALGQCGYLLHGLGSTHGACFGRYGDKAAQRFILYALYHGLALVVNLYPLHTMAVASLGKRHGQGAACIPCLAALAHGLRLMYVP